ncbi:MAG: NTP transferase domain-containing protein [Phycisphaerae bacterium]
MSLSAIILAAGKSTRMKSATPKPLHEICGRPMLRWITEACFQAGCDRLILVVGHGKDLVQAEFAGDDCIRFVEQAEQKGTGHAVMVCEEELKKIDGSVLILAGDLPLVQGHVLRGLAERHEQANADASMATAILEDPFGYGRVVRDAAGEFVKIVEQVDATPEEAAITESFPSLYCVKVPALLGALAKLTNDNKKGEYYLTDIFEHARRAGQKVLATPAVTREDIIAPNDRVQLAQADAVMQQRIQDAIRAAGVTVSSSAGTYIEADVEIGQDTVVHPFSFIGRGAKLGGGCVVGPFAFVPRGAVLKSGTVLAGNIRPESVGLVEGGPQA